MSDETIRVEFAISVTPAVDVDDWEQEALRLLDADTKDVHIDRVTQEYHPQRIHQPNDIVAGDGETVIRGTYTEASDD